MSFRFDEEIDLLTSKQIWQVPDGKAGNCYACPARTTNRISKNKLGRSCDGMHNRPSVYGGVMRESLRFIRGLAIAVASLQRWFLCRLIVG
jgi:hypothetical protein